MSLTTLKTKVNALIEKSKLANIIENICKDNKDYYDVVVPDNVGKSFFQYVSMSGFERSIINNVATSIPGSYFYACDGLIFAILPQVTALSSRAFYSCSSLETVEVGKITVCQTTTFFGCTSLKELKLAEGSTGNLYLQDSDNLTVECLENIIDNLADLTGSESKKLTIGTTNIAKISSEYKQKLTNKNYTYA